MPVQAGYGVQGIPDFIICFRSNFIAVETKFGNNPLSPWQDRQRIGILNAKGEHYVVNEHNINVFRDRLFVLAAMQ